MGTKGTSSSRPILHIAATGLSKSYSLHGALPVAISKTVHPYDQISAEVPNIFCVMIYQFYEINTSGGIQGIDPFKVLATFLSWLLKRFMVFPIYDEHPKSPILTTPWVSTSTLAPFMSPCTTLCLCRYRRPSKTYLAKIRIIRSSRAPRLRMIDPRLPWTI